MLGLGWAGKAQQDEFVWLGQRRRALEFEEVTVLTLGCKASSAPSIDLPWVLEAAGLFLCFRAGTGVVSQMIWLFFTIQGILFSALWESKETETESTSMKKGVME